MSELPEFILDRVFDAPKELVWRAWTDPKYLQRWYGPGAETTIHQFDLEPGGLWLNEMRWGEKAMYHKVVFKEVDKPNKLVWHHFSSVDADWNDAPNPMMPHWPKALLTTVTFAESDGQTKMRLKQVPMDATAEEITCFAEAMAGMENGWGSGFAIMDTLLEELK